MMCWFRVSALGLVLSATFALARPAATPTYTKDVAPILYAHCVTCHRQGEIAPFSLFSYQDAKKRADHIAQVTESGLMPPWKPEAGHGDFIEERRLTETQKQTLAAWAKAGAPEGNLADLPQRPKFTSGWKLGKPDLILKMPEAFKVPAEGRDIYMHFVFPLALPKDTYLRGIEVRPGNPKVAHHAIGLLDISGTARKLDAKHPGPGYPGLGSPGFIPAGLTPGYVPGQTPRFFDPSSGITIKAGADFVLQMHYHPVGKVEMDQTQVGLYFMNQKPLKNPTGVLLGSEEIDIPAGAKDHRVTDQFKLPADLEVTGIWAHMHMVGKGVTAWAELPDGQKRPLLKITDWDFNWQDVYRYKKSMRLPKDTIIKAEFTYDNSAENVRNPNKPPKRVRLGEMSTDEMAGLWIGGLATTAQDEFGLLAANVAHYIELTTRAKFR